MFVAKFKIFADSQMLLFLGKNEINKGKNENDVIKITISEIIIINPKSIIGFISLKIKDKNAQIVVSTVYIIGQNILLVVNKIISELLKDGLFFFNCTKRVLI